MVKLEGLQFTHGKGRWGAIGIWPTMDDLNTMTSMHYSRDANTIYIKHPTHSKSLHNVKYYDDVEKKFYGDHHDIVKLEGEDIERIKHHVKKKEDQRETAQRRREFVSSVTKGVKLDVILLTTAFLNGATSGGSQVKIDGDSLGQYYARMMKRIGDKEFLLGKTLCGLQHSQSIVENQILTVIARSNYTFWPTNSFRPGELLQDHLTQVVDWCTETMTVIQLKMPTARLNPGAYDHLYKEVVDTYGRAMKRWDRNIPEEKIESLEEMISIYGDKKKMKEHNAGLRMQYEMTK